MWKQAVEENFEVSHSYFPKLPSKESLFLVSIFIGLKYTWIVELKKIWLNELVCMLPKSFIIQQSLLSWRVFGITKSKHNWKVFNCILSENLLDFVENISLTCCHPYISALENEKNSMDGVSNIFIEKIFDLPCDFFVKLYSSGITETRSVYNFQRW